MSIACGKLQIIKCRSLLSRSGLGGQSITRRKLCKILCSQAAEDEIKKGLYQYKSGNKMAALESFENSLKQEPSEGQSQAALFNATCVHANFGDVELAQVSLREAVIVGLDFELAVAQPSELMLQISTPTQILLQLKRFSNSVGQKQLSPKQPEMESPQSSPGGQGDAENLFSTEVRGMDTSVLGVVRRVLVLLLVLSAFGIALFVRWPFLYVSTMKIIPRLSGARLGHQLKKLQFQVCGGCELQTFNCIY
eukprot:TRINITY_DN17985_c0_g1_i1.p1 TRINITY_DN17985_c0_g1~~TRINITY_DN17985_c0_g1_i1.p1  ORF type:complete len:273 (-),score=25.64 TRINITY_DN17985_c0_g1_i1:1258-2010(-)